MEGVLKNGIVTGTKREVQGLEGLEIYQVWDGQKWISEENWEYEKNYDEYSWMKKTKCNGCDNSFCDCQDEKDKTYREIRKLIKMQDDINKQILLRLDKLEREVSK